MEFYADRTRRPAHAASLSARITSYRVDPQVLRQVFQAVLPLILANPHHSLVLSETLWTQPVLEFRILATLVLGAIPYSEPRMIIDMVRTWMKDDCDEGLMQAIFENGFSRIHRQDPQAALMLAEEWLASDSIFTIQAGLRSLLPLVEGSFFEHLPVILRLIHPYTQVAPKSIRNDLLLLLRSLGRQFPRETAHLLRQTLVLPNSVDTPWLVRQTLEAFPAEIQTTLRASIRE